MRSRKDELNVTASSEPIRVVLLAQQTGHRVHLRRVAKLLGPQFQATLVDFIPESGKAASAASSSLRNFLANMLFICILFGFQLLPKYVARQFFRREGFGWLRRLAGNTTQVNVLEKLFQVDQELQLKQTRTVVVLAEENLLSTGIATACFMRQYGVKTVVFNYTAGVEEEWVDHFTRRPSPMTLLHRGRIGRRFCRLTDSGEIRLPADKIAQLMIAGHIPQQPWSGYIGMSSAYLVDSRDEAQRMGFLAHKMHVVEPVEAILATRLASSLDPSERFSGVGIALPPNQWVGTDSGEQAYEELLSRLAIVVAKINSEVPVIISPHPRIGWPTEALRATFGIEADRFVAIEELFARSMALLQFGSASFRIAEAMGTPIVDWDVFGYGTMRKLRPEPSQMLRHVTDEVGAVRELKKLMAKTGTGMGLPTTSWKGAELIRSIAEEELV